MNRRSHWVNPDELRETRAFYGVFGVYVKSLGEGVYIAATNGGD